MDARLMGCGGGLDTLLVHRTMMPEESCPLIQHSGTPSDLVLPAVLYVRTGGWSNQDLVRQCHSSGLHNPPGRKQKPCYRKWGRKNSGMGRISISSLARYSRHKPLTGRLLWPIAPGMVHTVAECFHDLCHRWEMLDVDCLASIFNTQRYPGAEIH